MDKDDLPVVAAVCVVASILLVVYIGIDGFMNFILQSFLVVTASTLLVVPVIKFVVSERKDVSGTNTIILFSVGLLCLITYVLTSNQTITWIITYFLKTTIYVLFISAMSVYIKKTLTKVL